MKRVLLMFIFLSAVVSAEVYRVPNFRGGMNLSNGDSTNLAPNEAISIRNMVIDGDMLRSRHGFSVWNDSTIVPSNEVEDCFVYQPSASTYRMVISSGGFVYIVSTLSGPSSINWPSVALMYTDTGTVSADTLFITDNFWSRLKVAYGDSVYLACSPDSDLYVIWNNNFKPAPADTIILLNKATPFTDSTGVIFEIWRDFKGPSFSQYKDKLYIADSLYGVYAGDFAMVYNDTDYMFLGVIDTGTVDDSVALTDTPTVISDDKCARMDDNSNIVLGLRYCGFNNPGDSTTFPNWSTVQAGDIFKITQESWIRNHGNFASIITSVVADTVEVGNYSHTRWSLHLEDIIPVDFYGRYAITHEDYPCGFADFALQDSSKDWFDIKKGVDFLKTFYIQSASDDTVYSIYCNTDDDVLTNGLIDIGNRYYIYSMLPYNLLATSDDYQQFPYLYQIMFHEERLWALGNQYSRFYYSTEGDYINKRGDVNVIWYSGPGYPEYIKYNYNQSIGNNEQLTCEFELVGERYFASANAIWRHTGSPGDFRTSKIFNVGFSDKKSIAIADNNIAYFANDDGIWAFNGNRTEKISGSEDFNIEVFHNRFKKSRIILGYMDDILYVSYPDSIDSTTYANYPNGVTLVWNTNYKRPTWFDFGMTFIMTEWADIDTNIFLFGHPNYDGKIFYYPNSGYYDSLTGSSAAPTCSYETGWQDLGAMYEPNTWSTTKSLQTMTIPMQVPGQATIYVYSSGINPVDFSSTVVDSFVTDKTGNFVFVQPLSQVVGEYFKFKIQTSSGLKFVLRPYEVNWQWGPAKDD